MDELTRILWDYACKCRLEGCYDLRMKTARAEEEEMAGRNHARLEALDGAEDRLEKLCYSLDIIRTVDMEAAFTCGLQLGLSLK